MPTQLLWLHVAGTASAALGVYGLVVNQLEYSAQWNIEWLSPSISILLLVIGIFFVIPSVVYLQKNKTQAEND